MSNIYRNQTDFITSLFTRERGYTDIISNGDYSRKRSIEILNSFTPQGASPEISMRIGCVGDLIGIGYYHMENTSDARLSTMLTKFDTNASYKFINLPQQNKEIHEYVSDLLCYYSDTGLSLELISQFDEKAVSILLYSVLGGDNIIVIHPDHEKRLRFFSELFQIFPVLLLKYNRLTTNCAELDGNENIIGVPKLPKKYRSHDKLHMSLDTIFVDLEHITISGGGSKTNDFTFSIANKILAHENPRDAIITYLQDALSCDEDYQTKLSNYHLIQNIRVKLGIEKEIETDWLMKF